MKVPFTADADFTGLMDNKDLKIEVVQQKSDLKVEEEGVIASSATAVVITTKGGFNPYQMIITRPFLFFLRNSELPQNYQMVMMAKIEEL
jgi:serine protease inhibitor